MEVRGGKICLSYESASLEEEDDFLNDLPILFSMRTHGTVECPHLLRKLFSVNTTKACLSIKDLSMKYGILSIFRIPSILQQRVKAIVYQKHLYWNEVYPRLAWRDTYEILIKIEDEIGH